MILDKFNKRIAYVGLSTPIFYDYSYQPYKSQNDLSSSPNPFLENPYALLLLYDEIWFLCESLCPYNMRYLPYVKFLDTDEELSKKIESINYDIRFDQVICFSEPPKLSDIVNRIAYSDNISWDNHSHNLSILNRIITARPMYENYIIDLRVVYTLKEYGLEMISNSLTSLMISDYKSYYKIQDSKKLIMTEQLVIDNITNYVTMEGPYHEIVEEMRKNSFITDFRRYINKFYRDNSIKEVTELTKEVNNQMYEISMANFSKEIRKQKSWKTKISNVGISVIGSLCNTPMFDIAQSLLDFHEDRKILEYGHIEFINNAKSILK